MEKAFGILDKSSPEISTNLWIFGISEGGVGEDFWGEGDL